MIYIEALCWSPVFDWPRFARALPEKHDSAMRQESAHVIKNKPITKRSHRKNACGKRIQQHNQTKHPAGQDRTDLQKSKGKT